MENKADKKRIPFIVNSVTFGTAISFGLLSRLVQTNLKGWVILAGAALGVTAGYTMSTKLRRESEAASDRSGSR